MASRLRRGRHPGGGGGRRRRLHRLPNRRHQLPAGRDAPARRAGPRGAAGRLARRPRDRDGGGRSARPGAGPGRGRGATRVGVGIDPDAPSPAIRRLAMWPRKVTLPVAVGPFPPPPDAGAPVIAGDAFGESPGRACSSTGRGTGCRGRSTAARGRSPRPGWRPPRRGVATVDAGATDVAATATVRLAGGRGWDDERLANVVPPCGTSTSATTCGRASCTRTAARRSSCGSGWTASGAQVNAKNITGLVAPGETHTLRLAADGARVAAYLDGRLVAEGTTALLGGTRAGLVIDEEAVNVSAFTAFEVAPVRAAPAGAAARRAGPTPPGRRGSGGGPRATAPPAAGVPPVAVRYDADVEDWWAEHPFNPERPDAVPVGGIASPEPVLDVAGRFGGQRAGGRSTPCPRPGGRSDLRRGRTPASSPWPGAATCTSFRTAEPPCGRAPGR